MVKKVDKQPDEWQVISEESLEAMESARSSLWQGLTDRDTGLGRTPHKLQDLADRERSPTAGDIDADRYLSKVVGEEAVGGTTPTPDQNVVEELAASVGIEIPDKYTLHTTAMLEERDCHRWELEVESSEDYDERLD
ncbi:DUF6335 family protein [Pseudanabaena sp. PCC 6802]|uniref:DUF6335 family protein n=1 Tax=Pseudanabaena sp. PCC 6802 TaxID=118173 RepID=UPI000349EED8|nr:DUF6335 family protein [Pseudanabaena sp. PCC 6802]